MRRLSVSLSAAAALALVTSALAGCGGSSTSSSTSAASSGSASTAAQGSRYGVPSSTAATSATTSSAAPAGATAVITTKHGKLGTILAVGGKQMTVYMFEGDTGSTSSCSGACAHVWPPVTTSGSPTASGTAVSADLGTITRPDGTMQVTYKGHPLYLFARDGDAGDAYGQGVVGFGSSWYVLSPSGAKVDHS